MIYYARLSAKKNRQSLLALFEENGAKQDEIYIDDCKLQKQANSLYVNVRATVISARQLLVIDSLSSLGKNAKEISKELNFFATNGVRVIVLDIPSTALNSVFPSSLLVEVFQYLATNEISRLKDGQAVGIRNAKEHGRPYGRKKIPFPANWDEQFALWKSKRITATAFQNNCGLKKGTFYHLLKEAQQNDLALENDFKDGIVG